MKLKKLASLLIAGVMVFSMAMPAFAFNNLNGGGNDNGNDNGGELANNESDLARSLKFTGTTSVPTISVDMATDAAIVLNPYGLTVTFDGNETTDPFLTSTIIITNKSNCPLAVSGSFTPSVGTDEVKLVANAGAADSGTAAALADKNVFVGVAIGNVTADDVEIDFKDTAANKDYRTKVKAAPTVDKFITWSTATGAKKGFYPLPTAGTAVKFGDENDTQANKLPYVMGAGNENPTYMGLRIFGLCEKYVKTAWTANDTVSVAMAMTLAPNSN